MDDCIQGVSVFINKAQVGEFLYHYECNLLSAILHISYKQLFLSTSEIYSNPTRSTTLYRQPSAWLS